MSNIIRALRPEILKKHRQHEKGFSLLEVLIALTILSIAMGGFFTQLRSHTQTAITMQERTAALTWLDQYLLGIQLGEGSYSKNSETVRDDRYGWQLHTRIEEISNKKEVEENNETGGISLKRLILSLYREDSFPESTDDIQEAELVARLSGVVNDAEE